MRKLASSCAKSAGSGLVNLKGLKQLQFLYLSKTQVTDAGLVNLKEMKQLQTLFLNDTQVTDTGVAELKKSLPNCNIPH